MSLAQKIANSYCRLCGKKGHWKAECPYRVGGAGNNAGSSTTSSTMSSMPTSTMVVDQVDNLMPLEFLDLPQVHETPIDAALPVFMNVSCGNLGPTPIIEGEFMGNFIVMIG